jgi:hypothetical protein
MPVGSGVVGVQSRLVAAVCGTSQRSTETTRMSAAAAEYRLNRVAAVTGR